MSSSSISSITCEGESGGLGGDAGGEGLGDRQQWNALRCWSGRGTNSVSPSRPSN